MQTYSKIFTGAATWTMNVLGSYFTVIGCTNLVNVRFYMGGAKLDLGDIQGVLAGLEVLPKKVGAFGFAFDRVEIDATAADTITIGVGNGDARYNRGAASVTVTNIPHVIVDPVKQQNPFYAAYGASYKGVAGLFAATPEIVFAPGANVNGAIIHAAAFTSLGAGNTNPCFIAKAGAAPASFTDGDVIVSPAFQSMNGANYQCGGLLQVPIFIAAGKGLYYWATAAEISAPRNALYTLL